MQSNARTVQGELTRVLTLLDHRPVTVHGAGRTDAGVHAEGQVASVLIDRDVDPVELRDAVNGNLDRDIRVLKVELASEDFNARYSAKQKTYRYRIWTGDVVSPFLYRYVHHYRAPLEIAEMRRAAAVLVGNHDFSAFTVADSEAEDHIRLLSRLDIEQESNEISIVAAANGFLRYMVRTIVGTLIDVGRESLTGAAVSEILKSRDRENAGPTAPARGLTLVRVDY
jgi:tRNA pseudouridine38-40 synthase